MPDERTQKLIDTYKTQGNLTTGQIGDVIATTPTNQPISSATLSGNQTPLKLPQIDPGTSYAALSGVASAVKDTTKEASQIQRDLETKQIEAQNKVSEGESAYKQAYNKVLETFGIRETLGKEQKVAEKAQKVTDYTNQLEGLDRAEQNEIRALDEQPGTLAQKAQRQADISRKYAFQKADVALLQSAANRDLLTAETIINNTINARLEPLKYALDFTKTFYEENKSTLDKADQRLFESKIKEDDRKYTEQKTVQENISKLLYSAITQEAPTSVIQGIQRAQATGDYNGAIQAAGVYGGNLMEKKLQEAQLANIYSQIAERNASGTGMQGSDLLAYAQQYASTGQIPTGLPKGTFGIVSQTAKELPKQNGAVVNSTTGIADSKTPATEQADYSRLYNILNNVKRLKQLDEERIGGIVSGTLGKIFGAEKQSEYLSIRKAIVDDMQRMQSGAALTPTETSFYEGYLPGRFSEPFGFGQDSAKKISNFENIITNRLNERLSANGLSIYGYSKVKTPIGEFTIGDVIEVNGQMGRINPDGTVTSLSQ